MRKALLTAAVIVTAALAIPSVASASSCGTRGMDYGRVTVKVSGATSCPFGWEAYGAFRRSMIRHGDAYPQTLFVRSPVTHRRYRLARVSQRVTSSVADWRYTGVGDHGSTLDVRIHWVAY